jgi:hypothetical protein
MKTQNLIFSVLFYLTANFVLASNPTNPNELIKDSKNEILLELLELNKLDQYIGNDYDLLKLTQEQPEMVKNVGLSSEFEFDTAGSDNPPLGIPGFIWGFCLGLIGMLVVYLAMSEGPDRKKQVNQALYGCLTWTLLYLLLILSGVIKVASVEPKTFEAVTKVLVA